MSLVAHYPLMGDLRDIVGGNDLVDALKRKPIHFGPFGQTYLNNSNSSGSLISKEKINLGKNQSMFCWVYVKDEFFKQPNLNAICGQHRFNDPNDSIPYPSGMGITMSVSNSKTAYVSVNTASTSKHGTFNNERTYATYRGSTALVPNKWYHIGYTYNGSTIKLYLDGKVDAIHNNGADNHIKNMNIISDYFGAFFWSFEPNTDKPNSYNSYHTKGCINDIRLYDHALSDEEVAALPFATISKNQLYEANKSCICHYDFNVNVEDNFDHMSYFLANFAGAWSLNSSSSVTIKRGDVDINKGTFSENSKGQSLRLKIKLSGASVASGGWYGIYSTFAPHYFFPTGTRVTRKCLMYVEASSTTPSNFACVIEGNSTDREFIQYDWDKRGTWQEVSMTGTLKDDANNFLFYFQANGEGAIDDVDFTCYMTNFEFSPEIKTNYEALPNVTKFQDKISALETNYSNVKVFPGRIDGKSSIRLSGDSADKQYIKLNEKLSLPGPMSYNIWASMNNWSEYAYSENGSYDNSKSMRIISCTDNGGWNIETNSSGQIVFSVSTATPGIYKVLTASKKWETVPRGWNMFTFTFGGGTAKGYLNGVEIASSDGYDSEIGYQVTNNGKYDIIIGAECNGSSNPVSGFFKGKISDFKMFAKALTAEEVEDEYRKILSLDNKKNFSAKLIKENLNSTSIKRSGSLESKAIVENQYMYTKDGAKFLKVFAHDIRNRIVWFNNELEARYNVDSLEKFSRLSEIPFLRGDTDENEGKFEFILKYPYSRNNRGLPSKYDAVEYLESPGGSDKDYRIPVGTIPAGGMKCEYEFAWTSSEAAHTGYAIGSHGETEDPTNGWQRNSAYLDLGSSREFWELGYSDICPQKKLSDLGISVDSTKNKKYKVSFSTAGAPYLKVDNYDAWFTDKSATKPLLSTTIYIFGSNYQTHSTAGKFYGAKVWDKDDNLIKDLVPCRNTMTDTMGVYDKVNGIFYGNDNFIRSYNRWKQTWNPLEKINDGGKEQEDIIKNTIGYEPVNVIWNDSNYWWGGLALSTSTTSAFLDCMPGYGNWFGGIAQYRDYAPGGVNGIPGADGQQHRYVELYVRVDKCSKFVDFDGHIKDRNSIVPSERPQYLQFNGSEYIDIYDYFANSKTEIEMDFKLESDDQMCLFSSRDKTYGSNANTISCFALDNGGPLKIRYDYNEAQTYASSRLSKNIKYHLTAKNNLNICDFFNNNVISSITNGTVATNNFRSSKYLSIGVINFDGSKDARNFYLKGKVYKFIIKENGVIKKNLIPAIKDNVYGLIDKINNKFYELKNSSAVSEYEFLESLKFNGKCYINTETTVSSEENPRVECSFKTDSYENDQFYLFGSSNYNDPNPSNIYYKNTFEFYPWNGKFQFNFDGNSDASVPVPSDNKTIVTLIQKNNAELLISYNGNEHLITLDGTDGDLSLSHPIYIGALKRNENLLISPNLEILYFKIYKNNKLVKDLVPYYNKTENKFGMYDKITDKFHEMQGNTDGLLGNISSRAVIMNQFIEE